MANDIAVVGGIADRRCVARGRPRCPFAPGAVGHRACQHRQRRRVAQVKPGGVAAHAINVGGQGNRLMRRPGDSHGTDDRDGISYQRLDRDIGIVNPVDERRIRAIFQKPSHEISKQSLMRADGGIDAAGAVQFICADDLVIQRFAHAVQALILIITDAEGGTRHLMDRRQRLRIVRRELREHHIPRGEQFARTGNIGHIGINLARIDREPRQAVDLRTLDLRIPIGALDKAHHDPPPGRARKTDHIVDHQRAALAISLHDKAEAVPGIKRRIFGQRLEQVERQLQPVGLLGIDVEADVITARQRRQCLNAGQQFRHHTLRLRTAITRVQRRQLDRDARAGIGAAPLRRLADRVDRLFIILIIALCIGSSRRRLAQHVVGKAKAAILTRARPRQRFVDRLARDELFAHHPHRHVDSAPDHRLANPCDHPGQRRRQTAIVHAGSELARHDQPPCRGIDEQRPPVAQMRGPVTARDLVADQRIARRRIGNAQQRLGKAHQRDALLTAQRIFAHQRLHPAARRPGAQPFNERTCRRLCGANGFGRQGRGVDQRWHAHRFRHVRRSRNRGAQRIGSTDGGRKTGKGSNRVSHQLSITRIRAGIRPIRAVIRCKYTLCWQYDS